MYIIPYLFHVLRNRSKTLYCPNPAKIFFNSLHRQTDDKYFFSKTKVLFYALEMAQTLSKITWNYFYWYGYRIFFFL